MINIEKLTEMCKKLQCVLKLECSLKDYTTFKIGGKCSVLIDVNSVESVKELLTYFKSENIRYAVIGRGSNIIASDDGFDGVILHFGNSMADISVDGMCIKAGAGASLAAVCTEAQKNGLTGMENLYGIPGTVGGGLYMNAGAYGCEMKDVVAAAEYIDENIKLCTVSAENMSLSYRHSVFSENNSIITSVIFDLKKGNPDTIKEAMTECMKKRISKQPLEYPSAGRTFKRPDGSYASLLIEQCGLKGMSVGGAKISEKHSGFVINTGSATYSDVIELCENVKNIVREKKGYVLELEPVILK
ncbi:MAG: UDP-N-acetylmuramate dehydrogenase [Ruminococcus sp.]|nr:UDP-N-acetylmuramate dehydrogenase [Ruminococcus sp.]